ncbi:12-(S)-hydroxy-5,8,10,14-eicosatetraenoic acid receptor [Engraulis encrasicolus]|uniref:12-(S)-hydroxy-5,8,10,14-eicosatetraenoic acid receptor n=1 Tax=Engraulis encrasicolus TaxID=184585 RepID=UPI002FCFCC45
MVVHAIDNCTAEEPKLYVFFSSVMIVEFILALPLNLTVLYLFIFKLKFWKTNSNNIFLFNLVLADILLLICLPVKAHNFLHGERRSNNKVVCEAMLFMLFLNRGASIAFLTVISIDRYLNVVHPGKKNFLKILKKSPQISILIWVLLLPLTTPTMLQNFDCCNSFGRDKDNATDILREIVFFTQILIPFIVLVFCTSRIVNRLKKKTVGDRTKLRRATFLVTSVMLVFSLCFLPCTIARMVLLIVRVQEYEYAEMIAVQVYDGLMCLSYLDLLLDPLVYCLSSTKFKSLYLEHYLPFLIPADGQPMDSTHSTGNASNASHPNSAQRTRQQSESQALTLLTHDKQTATQRD